jgi:peptide/nickel transport system substrate-binding protein
MSRLALLALAVFSSAAEPGGQLRFALRAEPKTFDPLLVSDESSEAVRYLTGGVLLRLNRLTQEVEPELAVSWKISEAGRRIEFSLRRNVLFSDGSPFSCQDVAFTVHRVLDPAIRSPLADNFRSGVKTAEAACPAPYTAVLRFPAPVAALAPPFDELAILSCRSTRTDAVLGPFQIAEYRAGSHVLLRRNPHYWKRDRAGRPLPYLESIRLDIQQNRDNEALRFRRGELDLINKLDPELFDRLAVESPKTVVDAGPSLDWELIFFNQAPSAPIPDYKKSWFRSAAFRRAISEAISRQDICRVVYRGHARPAAGPVSPSNRLWRNAALESHAHSPEGALRRLEAEGFRRRGDTLFDSGGHPVEFLMMTNSGNRLHERMLAMIQQDLAKIGVRLRAATLDFPSLIERISRNFEYEACLMAFSNIDLDPSGQMNIWLSSAFNHQWNPAQPTPATAWEAEIDRLMQVQAATLDPAKRKAAFDRVQQIVWEQAPFLFLVHPNALSAISPRVRDAAPAMLRPQLYWNAERLWVAAR